MSERLSRLLAGPPIELPAALDRASERWWASPPRIRAGACIGLVVIVALTAAVRMLASPYGPPEQVMVAVSDLNVGDRLSPTDLRPMTWPRDLVPEAAARADALEPGTTVIAPVPAGSIITARHVAHAGIASLLSDERVAVPIATQLLPQITSGMRLDLIGREHDRAVTLARNAVVLAVEDDVSWVAVNPQEGASVAAAAAAGTIVPVVNGS